MADHARARDRASAPGAGFRGADLNRGDMEVRLRQSLFLVDLLRLMRDGEKPVIARGERACLRASGCVAAADISIAARRG